MRPAAADGVTGPQVLVREDEKERRRLVPTPDVGWYLLGAMGLVFAVVGFTDLALVWYPANFGSAEFEFGSVTQTMNSLPLPTLGLTLLLASGVARGSKWAVRLSVVALLLVVVAILGMALLHLTTVPQALKAPVEPLARTGLKKAIAKTVLQFLMYPLALLYVSVKAWRHASASTRAVP